MLVHYDPCGDVCRMLYRIIGKRYKNWNATRIIEYLNFSRVFALNWCVVPVCPGDTTPTLCGTTQKLVTRYSVHAVGCRSTHGAKFFVEEVGQCRDCTLRFGSRLGDPHRSRSRRTSQIKSSTIWFVGEMSLANHSLRHET